MFCLQRAKPSFKFQKQGFPHYCEVFKAHTDPQISCGFRNSVRIWFLLQNSAGSKQKSYEIMTMKMFATLDEAKPNTRNIRGLNWTAVKRTTVQVYRLPLHYSIGQLEHDLLAETLHVCMYVCCILYTVHCFRIIDILFKYAYINCKYVVYCNHSHRLWLLTMDRYPIPSGEGGEASKLRNYYSNCHSNLRKIWSWTAGGARHQDGQAGRPPAVMWLRAWPSLKGLTLNLTVFKGLRNKSRPENAKWGDSCVEWKELNFSLKLSPKESCN